MDEVAEARSAVNKVEEIATRIAREGDACPNSFVPGTRVLLADGSSKPIEQVVVGDEVWASDPLTGESGPQAVVGTIVGGGVKHLVEITVDVDGDAGGATASVTATEGHPFWLPELRRWVTADESDLLMLTRFGWNGWMKIFGTEGEIGMDMANLGLVLLRSVGVRTASAGQVIEINRIAKQNGWGASFQESELLLRLDPRDGHVLVPLKEVGASKAVLKGYRCYLWFKEAASATRTLVLLDADVSEFAKLDRVSGYMADKLIFMLLGHVPLVSMSESAPGLT
ncbi:Hint domain-containing protein [Goodfellowiella coeruleoviolacea]|uniref:Hint domain-containing protein n=1 Tax=Goodfellowiella coeruleoviolacea TaxID=334858 RepID=UPI0020A3F6FB|nr:Hint domain-containing protein [Goodfellowiella coeruleoviolacea]